MIRERLFEFVEKNDSTNITFLILFSLSFILSLLIFLTLTGNLSNLEEIDKVSSLISINFAIIVILILISVGKIKENIDQKKFRSKFKVHFTLLFIFISLIPSTLITIFSLIFFDQGIKIWFNDKIKQVINGSKNISESYFSEHISNIKNDVLFLQSEINNEKIVFFTDRERLTEFLSYFAEIKDLEEAIIFEGTGQLLAKVGSFLIESETAPPLWSFLIADDGDIAVFPNSEKTKVRALIRIQRAIPTYLFIGKDVDSNVLSRVESVDNAASEYLNITKKLDNFQSQFVQLFIAINFLMILLSIWFGLRFSNRIIEPIMQIILDSEKIIKEDFSTRIRVFKGNNEFNILSNVLNKMLDILNNQKNKLLKAKEIINLRRKFTENIINNINTGIIYVDLNGKVLLSNKNSQEIFDKKVTRDFLENHSNIQDIIKKFKLGKIKNNEIQIKYLANYKLKFLNIKISEIIEKNSIKGFILSIDDVSELVSAQKHAAWSNVARYMAHEIRNPLTPIKLSAQRLEKTFLENKVYKKSFLDYTDTIKRQVNNIQTLVSDFSNFARMPESIFKEVKLSKIIETQIKTIKILDSKIKFNYNNTFKELKINCDENQIGRVFLNILKNSYESSQKKKKVISVKINKEKKLVLIDIEDNGIGFPENRDKLFEPYITNKVNGTGLGLAICKKIIEDHGGEINLLDSSKFGGACVRLKLIRV